VWFLVSRLLFYIESLRDQCGGVAWLVGGLVSLHGEGGLSFHRSGDDDLGLGVGFDGLGFRRSSGRGLLLRLGRRPGAEPVRGGFLAA